MELKLEKEKTGIEKKRYQRRTHNSSGELLDNHWHD
ncbi:unnamed protein product [Lathyrus sativus]|nr:unnamed protein product [Lathyrus sativus]